MHICTKNSAVNRKQNDEHGHVGQGFQQSINKHELDINTMLSQVSKLLLNDVSMFPGLPGCIVKCTRVQIKRTLMYESW